MFDLPVLIKRVTEIEQKMSQPGFWDERENSQQLAQEKSNAESSITLLNGIALEIQDAGVLLEMAQEADDEQTASEAGDKIDQALRKFDQLDLERMFSGEHDSANAILQIHSGAGGTEACDWAEMLTRMYTRWCERRGHKVELIDSMPGEEAGLKSATLGVEGKNIYGMLKAEVGIHRLVRISPFDAQSRRHTSFASIFAYPDVEADLSVEIDEKELRIDTYRASGAGGQHVNKTSSAVRITHLPTNIVVQCQNERSQHKNKALALKVLKARLLRVKEEEAEAKMALMHAAKKEIAWGSQIRSYVLQPYRMVKDHRTSFEKGNVDDVLDGNIDQFIESYLKMVGGAQTTEKAK
ncbi:MAG: peptide chain release factor 2 [Candidatus Alcyoniella australis]|nr:peptide chain release factor 2 [Candidatus Alcyoniella australis]